MQAGTMQLRLEADISGLMSQMALASKSTDAMAASIGASSSQIERALAGIGASMLSVGSSISGSASQIERALGGVGSAVAGLDAAMRTSMQQSAASMARMEVAISSLGPAMATSFSQAIGELMKLQDKADEAADKVKASFRRMTDVEKAGAAFGILDVRPIREIQKEIDRADAAYKRLADSGKLSAADMSRASIAHQSAVARLRAEIEGIGKTATVSAAQTAQAMRMLPAQFSDVAVSLAGGQNPLMVLLQQGSQVKESFGGFGAMFKGIGSAISPVALAIGSIATAGGLMIAAFISGQREAAAIESAIIRTGNAAGVTRGQVMAMGDGIAQSLRAAGVSVGAAREAVAAAVGSGAFGMASIRQASEAIAAYSAVMGVTADESAKVFGGMGKDVAGWAAKQNETLHFLNGATYSHIRALQEQGRTQEAAAVATQALTKHLTAQPVELGFIDRALRATSQAWSSFWDSAKGVGRAETVEERLKAIETRIADLKGKLGDASRNQRDNFDAGRQLPELEDYAKRLRAVKGFDDAMAAQQSRAAEAAAKNIEAQNYMKALRAQASPAAQLRKELEEFKRHRDALAGTQDAITAAEEQRIVMAIRRRNADKDAQALADADFERAAANAKAAADAKIRAADEEQSRMDALRAAGLLSEREAAAESLRIERERIAAQRALVDQQIRLEKGRKLQDGDPGAVIRSGAKITALESERSGLDAKSASAAMENSGRIAGLDLADAREAAQRWAATWQQASDKVAQLTRAAAEAQANAIADPVERARALAEISIAAIKRDAETVAMTWGAVLDQINGRAAAAANAGDAATAAALQGQADALQKQRDMADRMAKEQAIQARGKVVDDYLSSNPTAGLASGWDDVSTAIVGAVASMLQMAEAEKSHAAAVRAAGDDAARLAALEVKRQQSQMGGYAALAGAAKGFFGQHTAGYKALATAEKAFRAVELAMAIQSAMRKLGLIATVTTAKVAGDQLQTASAVSSVGPEVAAAMAKGQANALAGVANQANGDPYSAFPRMAAMAAAMAALGFIVSGGGGTSGSFSKTNEGAGTVLGDSGAHSKSIEHAIAALREVDTMTMRYSAEMLASLRNIEAALGGVASLIVSGGTLDSATGGIQPGFKRDGIGSAIGTASDNLVAKFFDGAGLGFMGDLTRALGSKVAGLFGTKTTVNGTGLYGAAQTLGAIESKGFDAKTYADVTEKKKFLGMTTRTKNTTRFSEASAEIEQQFGLILGSFADTLRSAAGPLGIGLDGINARLSAFVVDIGKISLSGLSGTQIQEKLTAVFNAASDKMGRAAITGLDDFQRVGEGYFETIIRVATGSEQAQHELRKLGISMADLSAVTNKQGNVGAELVRTSLVAAESLGGTLSGIGAIVNSMDGTAEEIADAFASLDGVRASLEAIGLSGRAVSSDLLAGAGGLDALVSSLSDFEKGFFTEAEQVAFQSGRMEKQFAALGLAMPASREGFRALVKGIDASGAAGQDMLGRVLALSGGFADMQDAMASMQETMASLGKGIEDEINRIRGLMGGGGTAESLQAKFAVTTAQARAGDQAAIDALPQVSKDMLAMLEKQATSQLDVTRSQAQTMASLEQTLAIVRTPGAAQVAETASLLSGAMSDFVGPLPTGEQSALASMQAMAPMANTQHGMAEELRLLREEVAALRATAEGARTEAMMTGATLASNTGKVANILDRVTPAGDAIATREAAVLP